MPILMSILESLLQALPRIEIRYRHPFKESDHVRPAYLRCAYKHELRNLIGLFQEIHFIPPIEIYLWVCSIL